MNSPRDISCHLMLKLVIAIMAIAAGSICASAQRKITPVNTPATATQPVNELKDDTAYINKRMRATMIHYHDEDGNVVYVDTVTGREWRDSTALKRKIPMKYPLWQSVTVGVDLWNPVMRVFGQHFGIIDFMGQVNLHNRYRPTFETGLGLASYTPSGNNFTYKSPTSVYFRIGADYNFLYNSTPDYQFTAGLRYGCSPFSFSVEDITIESPYWDVTARPVIPSQRAFVGWWEFTLGLRVNLKGPISAGWLFRYHSILHESKCRYGNPWYIPGYGARGQSITGSIYITYTLDINKKPVDAGMPSTPEIYIPTPETDDPYQPGIDDSTSEDEQDAPVIVPAATNEPQRYIR